MTDVRNFNTWDLATSFEETSHRYQLAVVVAQYADVLRHSPWATGTSSQQLVNHAYRLSSILWDDTEVVEFAHPRIPGAWSAGRVRSGRWKTSFRIYLC